MSGSHSLVLRRLLAFSADWMVVALWGGTLYGLVMIASRGDPPVLASAWQSQLVGLLAITIPFVLYFAVCESSRMQASLGKRLLGLAVLLDSGQRVPLRTAIARNAIKFLPWEFGHTVAHHAIASGEQGLAPWVWAPAFVAFAGPVWWIVAMLRTARAPYDRWTSVRVEDRGHP